jgi:hypothetical protein
MAHPRVVQRALKKRVVKKVVKMAAPTAEWEHSNLVGSTAAPKASKTDR